MEKGEFKKHLVKFADIVLLESVQGGFFTIEDMAEEYINTEEIRCKDTQ